MRKQLLILPILFLSAIIRIYYLIQISKQFDFVSLMLNIASIAVFWIFIQLLFQKKFTLSLFITIFLSISPWHIYLSKEGIKINLMLICLLIIIATLKKFLYHRSKVFYITGLLLSLIILYPLNLMKTIDQGLLRNQEIIWLTHEQRGEHLPTTSIVPILHNKLTNYSSIVLNNYSKHFSFQTLFLDGDHNQSVRVPEMGFMYLFDFIFLFLGLINIFRKLNNYVPVLLWLILAPIPSSLSNSSQISLTSYNMVVPLLIISGVGLNYILKWISISIKNSYIQYTFFSIVFLFIIWDISRFLHQIQSHILK